MNNANRGNTSDKATTAKIIGRHFDEGLTSDGVLNAIGNSTRRLRTLLGVVILFLMAIGGVLWDYS